MKTPLSAPLLLFVALLLICGCQENKATPDAPGSPLPVLARPVRPVAVEADVFASGNIEGRKTVKLGFLVAGRINSIAASEGSAVQAGQLLASLDPENYRIAKEMADANADQVQDEFNRLALMHERKSISEGDFAKITNALKVARAQQKLQNKNLADTKLYSPITGVLLKRGVEVGEIIGSGLPLFAVSDISTIHVTAAIPESDLRRIKIGSEASVFVSSLDASFSGKVVEVGSLAEPTTRAFTVKVELANPKHLIRPGMTAEVRIATGQQISVIAVPAEAVLRDLDNSSYVFIADTAKKQAFKRKISLGRMHGSNVAVSSGLSPHEWIVVGGQQKLGDGSAIALKQAP